jgi:hypothetical protein
MKNGCWWQIVAVAVLLVGCSTAEPEVDAPVTSTPSLPSAHHNVVDPADASGSAVTFDFTYEGAEQHWTDEAKAALTDAANSLAAYLVVPKPVTITYTVREDNEPNHLAQASSDRIDTESPGYYPTVVQHKLITGEDANGPEADGEIDVNWDTDWALGDTVAPDDEDSDTEGQYDFKATIMHELVHTLGFDTNVQGPGAPPVTNRPIFDEFIVTADGAKPINDDYTWNTAYDANLTGGNGGLYFGGPNAVAADDGEPVPLLTDKEWSVSSVTHLDTSTYTGDNKKMMNPGDDPGLGVRVLSPIELGILEDIGYTVK